MKKILIIDDEEGIRFFMQKNLELRGNYDVLTADDGESGIRLAEAHLPDLILLDIIMPGMDGFEVLKILKSNEKTKSIPVVLLTAIEDNEARDKALKLHDNGYIVKPIKISELEEKIGAIFEKHE